MEQSKNAKVPNRKATNKNGLAANNCASVRSKTELELRTNDRLHDCCTTVHLSNSAHSSVPVVDTGGFRSSTRHSSTRARRSTAKKMAGCCYKPERSSASFRLRLAGYFPNLPKVADLRLWSAPPEYHSGDQKKRCRIPAEPARDPSYSLEPTSFVIRRFPDGSTKRCRSRKLAHSRRRFRSPTAADCWRARAAAKTLRRYSIRCPGDCSATQKLPRHFEPRSRRYFRRDSFRHSPRHFLRDQRIVREYPWFAPACGKQPKPAPCAPSRIGSSLAMAV
jgi:hypothetical protein